MKADVQRRGVGARFLASLDSLPIAIAVTVACGLIAALTEYPTHIAVAHMSAPKLQLHASIDATVIGLITVALLGSLIALIRARRRMVLDELKRVAELNHNVRNALQVIRNAQFLERDGQAEAIVASVDRIDEALRELFPALRTGDLVHDAAKSRLLRPSASPPAEKTSKEG